jgi:hypothetical protein
MPHAIQVGDTVAFTPSFLDRHSTQYHSEMPIARGKVTALNTLLSGVILADIAWDKPGLSKRVNVKNLDPIAGSR